MGILFLSLCFYLSLCPLSVISVKIIGVKSGLKSILRPLPSPPSCQLSDTYKTSIPIEVKIWKYQDRDENQFGYLVWRETVSTTCWENFLGVTEKTINYRHKQVISNDSFFEEHRDIEHLVDKLRDDNFEEPAPTWTCRWMSTTTQEETLYHVKKVLYEYDPSSETIMSPPGILTQVKEGVFLMKDGQIFVTRVKSPKFNRCNFNLFKISHGTMVVTTASVHQLVLNQLKEIYYLDEWRSYKCKDVVYYVTRGGYVVSYMILTSQNHPHDTTPAPSTSLDPTSNRENSTGSDLDHPGVGGSRGKRSTSLVFPPGIYKKGDVLLLNIDPKQSYSKVPLGCPEENFFLNAHIGQDIYDTSPDALCNATIRVKRSVTTHEESHILENYQHSLSRTELQWGLFHLSTRTSSELTALSQDICNEKRTEYFQALMLLRETKVPRFVIYLLFPELTVYNLTWEHGVFIINPGEKVAVELKNPLRCCGSWCKTQSGSWWIESHTRILTESPECQGYPKSFLVQDEKTENWIDVISGKLMPPLYELVHRGVPDLTEYSFNTSELYPWQDRIMNDEILTISSSGKPRIRSQSGKFNFGYEWMQIIGNWFSSTLGRVILSMMMIGTIGYVVLRIFKMILDMPVTKRNKVSSEVYPLV